MDTDADRPVVLVTGGSRGIGRAIAERLIADGCTVIITGRDPERLRATGMEIGAAEVAVAEATMGPRVEGLLDGVVERWGRVDVLVNNAGLGGFGEPLLDGSIDEWWRIFDVNVRGAGIAMRAALRHMTAAGSGLVVNLGSYTALNRTAGASAYGASKAALAHLTASVAHEVEPTGVTVLCVSPGLVATDMTSDRERFRGLPDSAWTPIEAVADMVSDLVADPPHDLTGRFLHARDDLAAIRAGTARVVDDDLYRLQLNGLDGRLGT